MLIIYQIDYLKTENVGPYKICLQKFYRGAFAKYRILITDILCNNNPSGFYTSLKDAEIRFNQTVKDTKNMLNSNDKQFFLDNTVTVLTTNEYYVLVASEMKENITVNIHSYRDYQHLYYGTVHFSRDKDFGIFYDLYVPVTDYNNSVDILNEEYGDLKLINTNSINGENEITTILDKYGYDNISGLAAFKDIVTEAINNFRADTIPTSFDIRQKFITGEYTEKDLDDAVKCRWISADQALKMIMFKAHLDMDNKYNKSKKGDIRGYSANAIPSLFFNSLTLLIF